jgi:hypothetical protein
VSPTLDLGVTIERVRVRAGAVIDHGPAPVFVAGYLGPYAGAPPHDHRIVVHELCIEVEAELDASGAHGLGKQLAWDLVGRLAALQDRRRPRIERRKAGGPIRVETLRLYLRGEISLHPPSDQICTALMTAVEERVRDGC